MGRVLLAHHHDMKIGERRESVSLRELLACLCLAESGPG